MLHPINCLYCKKRTKIISRRIRSKHNNASIVINNAPIFYCPYCKDIIIPLEVISAFKQLKTQPLEDEEVREYDFNEITGKENKSLGN